MVTTISHILLFCHCRENTGEVRSWLGSSSIGLKVDFLIFILQVYSKVKAHLCPFHLCLAGHWTATLCLLAAVAVICVADVRDPPLPPPSRTAAAVCCGASLFLSLFGSFSSFAQLLLVSLCLPADGELISSFERVMIPLCWDYVCVQHTVMAWLFIACRILIPQLKEWDDTCRELCASCSLTWKNGH